MATGIAAIPLLLTKLWVVYPSLWSPAWLSGDDTPFDDAVSAVVAVWL